MLGLHEVLQRLDLGKRLSLRNSLFSSIFRGHNIGIICSGNDIKLVHIIKAYHPSVVFGGLSACSEAYKHYQEIASFDIGYDNGLIVLN